MELDDLGERFDVSRETLAKLGIYLELLRKWNPKINLVSKSTLQSAVERHFVDSLQLLKYVGEFSSWVDIGSGAGFPGMVCAIAARENFPNASFTMVESDARKSAFLRTVSRETNTDVRDRKWMRDLNRQGQH